MALPNLTAGNKKALSLVPWPYPIWGICSRCFSVPFLIISMAPYTTGIVEVFICHSFSILISTSFYLDSFLDSATKKFLSRGTSNRSVYNFFLLSLIERSGLLVLVFLSVCMVYSHKMVTLSVSWQLLADFAAGFQHVGLHNVYRFSFGASVGHPDVRIGNDFLILCVRHIISGSLFITLTW